MSEMTGVFSQAERRDVEAIVITEKDAVKIPADVARETWSVPVYVISVEVTFGEGAEEMRLRLKENLEAWKKAREEQKKG